MNTLQAVVLGAVQGITEFLPISSSGHLVLLQSLWHIRSDGLLFVTLLHVGTLVAVCFVMRRELAALARNPLGWMGRMVLVALLPTFVMGAVFEEFFDGLFQSPVTLGFEFVITGVVLWWMDTVANGDKLEADMTASDAFWIGVLQGVAIFPALSRSGLTIAAGLWRGLDKEAAGRFSFLLSIPAILGATLVELEEWLEAPSHATGLALGPAAAGVVAAALAGYLSAKGTLWVLKRSRMRVFAVYVWALAAFVFADQLFWHHWFPPLW
ncbi:MAG: undecaprenyl-diphosphate phosphatase [Alicyclobacillus sp.]|nr:undecaprenyl-diphosphate phosphatase [Alicyclobacillus sp.]